MAFLSINDPGFWNNVPEELEHIKDNRGGGHVAYFPMGETKNNPPTVVILQMAPGWVLPRHAHDCYRIEVVLAGSLDVGDRVLGPGDMMVTPPNTPYGPHTAGPEGSTTVEFFTDYRSSYTPLIELDRGLTRFDTSTAEGRLAMLRAAEEQKATAKGL